MHRSSIEAVVLVFIVLTTILGSAHAAVPGEVSTWQTTAGGIGTDYGRAVVQTADGGYAVAGYSTGSSGGPMNDVYLVKINSRGIYQWSKTYGGTSDDCGYSVVQTSDGGYAIAGQTYSYGAGRGDVYLVKTDSAGNKLWERTYGGGTRADCGYSVVQTSDGGYAIAGQTYSYGAGSGDAYLVKTDSLGNMAWNKTYGGTGDDCGYSVVQCSDGGYAITGYTSSFAVGSGSFYLVKTDSLGNKVWSKTYGGTGADCGYSVVQTSDGGYAIAGHTYPFGASNGGVYLVKTDSLGNLAWDKNYGGPSTDFGFSVVQCSDGGYAITGSTSSFGVGSGGVYLVKTNSLGNKVWSKNYGGTGDDCGYSVVQCSDGGYAIAGFTYTGDTYGIDIYLVKTDFRGEIGPTLALEVPYQNQGYSQWCAPTSLAMVLRYYGLEFHGWDYASDKNLGTNDGSDLTDLGQYVQEKYPYLTVQYGNYFDPTNKDQIFIDIQSSLSQGYPVILNIGSGLSHGHDVVAIGYNATGLFVNDPSGYLIYTLLNTPQNVNEAYASWTTLKTYVRTWPSTSTLIIEGVPNPDARYGTMYTDLELTPAISDIVFCQPSDTSLELSHTQLVLNKGLSWEYVSQGGSEINNVIEPSCYMFSWHVVVSNCKQTPEDFEFEWRIIGPKGDVYTFEPSTQLKQVDGLLTSDFYSTFSANLNSLSLGGPYILEFWLLDSKGTAVDHFVTPQFYRGGQSIMLSETQHHLYLHVYDAAGNHVGLNYATNQTELGIPGSYYMDDGNGTIMVSLPSTDKVKVVVDAKYAENSTEAYNVTVTSKSTSGVSVQNFSNTINVGQNQTVIDLAQVNPTPTPTSTSYQSPTPTQSTTSVTPTPKTTVTPTPSQSPTASPTIPEFPTSMTIILITGIVIIFTITKIKKKTVLNLQKQPSN